MQKKRAVLLVNLGTPEHATQKSVRQFLKPFLSDKRVVDLPRLLWLPILYLVVLPFRSLKVTKYYQKIWTSKGSPLRIFSHSLTAKLGEQLKDDKISCHLAMTYGQPSIAKVMAGLSREGVTELTVIPLYPQYSVSTTAAVFDQIATVIKNNTNFPALNFKHNYHDHPLYIDALCHSIKEQWEKNGQSEKLIFSYHGIPKRYVTNGDPYQAHCQRTTALVVKQLGLTSSQYLLAYQSRMGKEQWLMPYVDLEIAALAEQGCDSIDVICPAFATDCLETLEEMAMQNKALFLTKGGKAFHYIACLNDQSSHVKLLATLTKEN